jgi:hypothetical protein
VEFATGSFEDDAAHNLNYIAVGDCGNRGEVFVDDDGRDAGFAHGSNDVTDFLGDELREAFRDFIEDQQVRIGN